MDRFTDSQRTPFNLMSTGISLAGAAMLEETGKLTGISYCRPLRDDDLNDLRRAVKKAWTSLAVFDAVIANGVQNLSLDTFNELRKQMDDQGSPR